MGKIFIDSNDNQFKTERDAEQFYEEKFENEVLKKDFETLSEYLAVATDIAEIMEWIFKDHPEILSDFYKSFSSQIERAKENYIDDELWDLEEIDEWVDK